LDQDVRWKQRYQNFQKALGWLRLGLEDPAPDEVRRAGTVQFFEMTFELGWKVLKDYLEEQGFSEVATPRAAIKKAFEVGLVENGRGWLKGLDDRNLTTHLYDEATAQKVYALARDEYLGLFEALDAVMAQK
jgi:nucleotidyltransferase substrate binding protein (TIGR01987 family)